MFNKHKNTGSVTKWAQIVNLHVPFRHCSDKTLSIDISFLQSFTMIPCIKCYVLYCLLHFFTNNVNNFFLKQIIVKKSVVIKQQNE